MLSSVLSMLDLPGRIDCGEVRFLVHTGWNGRDVSMASMRDCVKECVSFVM